MEGLPAAGTDTSPWQGFQPGLWQEAIDVRDFIQQNYRPYEGDEAFLAPATPRTKRRRLSGPRRPMWIRFVRVSGLTDDLDDLARTAEFAASLGNVERVEVLPFHQLGRFEWERLGLDCTLADTEPPGPELCERADGVFRAVGLEAY